NQRAPASERGLAPAGTSKKPLCAEASFLGRVPPPGSGEQRTAIINGVASDLPLSNRERFTHAQLLAIRDLSGLGLSPDLDIRALALPAAGRRPREQYHPAGLRLQRVPSPSLLRAAGDR